MQDWYKMLRPALNAKKAKLKPAHPVTETLLRRADQNHVRLRQSHLSLVKILPAAKLTQVLKAKKHGGPAERVKRRRSSKKRNVHKDVWRRERTLETEVRKLQS
jgi:hypothetical protein